MEKRTLLNVMHPAGREKWTKEKVAEFMAVLELATGIQGLWESYMNDHFRYNRCSEGRPLADWKASSERFRYDSLT